MSNVRRRMDPLTQLNQTLRLASAMLDSAASQIRDAPLSPTKEHIESVGRALVCIFDIQNAIYKLRPELEPKYEEAPAETRAANRRLGEALIEAYDLADASRVQEAIEYLSAFAESEPSEFHREIAKGEIVRLQGNYGA